MRYPGDSAQPAAFATLMAGVLMGAVSCVPQPASSFDSLAPNARLDAIVEASSATDLESLRQLVGQLDSDDPAARLLAITALRKRTGQSLGYLAADQPWRRGPAVERWHVYIADQEKEDGLDD